MQYKMQQISKLHWQAWSKQHCEWVKVKTTHRTSQKKKQPNLANDWSLSDLTWWVSAQAKAKLTSKRIHVRICECSLRARVLPCCSKHARSITVRQMWICYVLSPSTVAALQTCRALNNQPTSEVWKAFSQHFVPSEDEEVLNSGLNPLLNLTACRKVPPHIRDIRISSYSCETSHIHVQSGDKQNGYCSSVLIACSESKWIE